MNKVCSEWEVSIRRACAVLVVCKGTYHYKLRRSGQADLKKRIKEIAETRMRYGYRNVHVVLQREGWMINDQRAYRLYSELGLQLRNKSPKRRVKAKLREDRYPASTPNETWAMNFVHDQLALGNKLKVLTAVDIFSKFSPVIDPRFSYRAEDVVMTLERACGEIGYPRTIRVTRAVSSCRAISTCGLTRTMSRSTSRGLANRLTTPSSSLQQQGQKRVPERALVHEP